MGRGARTPAFLESLGFGRPDTEHSTANATYASQLLRMPAGMVNEKMTMVFPEPNLPTGGALSSYENDTWMLTVYRLDQLEPPADLSALMELAARFVSPALSTALQAGAEPLGEMDVFRYPGGAWRRYDKMQRFPAGLLVFGDAICSLSPIYTQGMTVAVLEAVALRECLSQSDSGLSRRFFDAAAGVIGPQWVSNQFNDLYMYTSNDGPAVSEELLFLREEVLTGRREQLCADRKVIPDNESR